MRVAAILAGAFLGGFCGGAVLDMLDILPDGSPRVLIAGALGLLGAALAARVLGGGG